ncbi:MAG: sugar nucleotide-binding protein, partial [Gammaproteobacteria bacterium]
VTVVDAIKAGRQDIYGLYHVTNSGHTDWHGFASEIFAMRGDPVDLSPISTHEYPTPAPRPAYSVLSCDRLDQVFNLRLPDWQDGLARCLSRL